MLRSFIGVCLMLVLLGAGAGRGVGCRELGSMRQQYCYTLYIVVSFKEGFKNCLMYCSYIATQG